MAEEKKGSVGEPNAQPEAGGPVKVLEQRLQTIDRDLKASHKRMGDQDALIGKLRTDAKSLLEERDGLREELDFYRENGSDEEKRRVWEADRAVKRAIAEREQENRSLHLQVKMRDYKDDFGIPLAAMQGAEDEKDLALKVALWRLDNPQGTKGSSETPPAPLRTGHPGNTDGGALPTTAFQTREALQDAYISGKIDKDTFKREAPRHGITVPP